MKRLYYLDTLKVMLTVLVVFHHAAEAYSPYSAAQYGTVVVVPRGDESDQCPSELVRTTGLRSIHRPSVCPVGGAACHRRLGLVGHG